MRAELHDRDRRLIGTAPIEPEDRPTRVEVGDTPVFLDWDGAIDDRGRLRRCPACGCKDLYVSRRVGSAWLVLGVVVSGAVLLVLDDLGHSAIGKSAFCVCLIVVLSVWLLSGKRLTCYSCRSRYDRMPIAPQHRPWQRTLASLHRKDHDEKP